MGNSSESPGQIISLPQGGGALRGIGEKFVPDLFTGTGNFTIPISLPPGRNGFQPQLSLIYSTGNGHSVWGLGWRISVPGIERKTSKGIPHYIDERDVYVLSGVEDLVPVAGGPPEATRYQPRTEGLFARINHIRDAQSDFWEVRTKDGITNQYGTPQSAGFDPAVVAQPADPSRIFSWKLTSSVDPFGNRIEYSYQRDAVRKIGPHEWDQLYLSRIRYLDYGDQANPKFLVEVNFIYEQRPDPFSDYRAGFEIRTVQRCTRIEVCTNADQLLLTRSYHFVYLDQEGMNIEELPANGISLLSRMEIQGHDGQISESLPPLKFQNTKFQPSERKFVRLAGTDLPSESLANPDYELVDLLGNGLPDVLEMNGVVRYWRNLGEGRFDLPRLMENAPAGVRLSDSGVQLIDANGDGTADLLVTSPPVTGYYGLRFGGLWDDRAFTRYAAVPSFDLKDPEVRLVDLDGDGVTDAIRSSVEFECFFNDPEEGWNATRHVPRQDTSVFPDVSFSDPRVKWADLTGDGLQDIVLIHDGAVEYWPSLGRGNWGKRVLMRNSPRLPFDYNPKRILVGDVDGDGLADIVYVDDGSVTLWINQSGNGWSAPLQIMGTPPVSDMDAVRLTDILGNGVAGVLWSSDAQASPAKMFFLDFTGGVKPYLLSEMDNNAGAITRVGYAPSTKFYLQDEKKLETKWKSTLPFPVQVVETVEVIDIISGGKLTTHYSYHHGHWDGGEREFCGFARVDQRDTEIFSDFHGNGLHPKARSFNPVPPQYFSPPTETRTWFHQGPIGDEYGSWIEADHSGEYWSGDAQAFSRPSSMTALLASLARRARRDALRAMRGNVLRSELYSLDGTPRQDLPYTVVEKLYGIREESPPQPGQEGRQHIFFVHTLGSRQSQWERGTDPMTTFTFSADFDAYGQARSNVNIAVPRGKDFRSVGGTSSYLATHSIITYAQRDDAHVYIIDRLASSTAYEVLGNSLIYAAGTPSIYALSEAILSEDPGIQKRVYQQSIHFYDGNAFAGLPAGQLDLFGALMRTENLVLTEEIVQSVYGGGGLAPASPYFTATGIPQWPLEYPNQFLNVLPGVAGMSELTRPGLAITPLGYGFADGVPPLPFLRGYFVATERRKYDFHDAVPGRGLVKVKREALGRDSQIAYDRFEALPVCITDSVGLETIVAYDYRVLQVNEAIEPNKNHTTYTFTPLGLLKNTAIIGKTNEDAGDTRENPTTVWEYDFLAVMTSGSPISLRTTRRVHHASELDVPLPERDETIEIVEFSDGFGRPIQTRSQGENVSFGDPLLGDSALSLDPSSSPGDSIGTRRTQDAPPLVIVSAWKVYDNKGRIVEQFEPFVSTGWKFEAQVPKGYKTSMFYDSLGKLTRIINADDSERTMIFGIPADLSNPDLFYPTGWEFYDYDANDNAGRTHGTTALGYQSHWDTPSSTILDALSRPVQTVQRNGKDSQTEWFVTKTTYDLRGNITSITDPLARRFLEQVFDLDSKPLQVTQLDAGIRHSIFDAAGNLIEQRDSRGGLVLRVHDLLNRPSYLWARDNSVDKLTLRQALEYGDAGNTNQSQSEREASRSADLLGRCARHFDEAGVLEFEKYDFKGNVLEKTRRVIADASILEGINAGKKQGWNIQNFQIDWAPAAVSSLADRAIELLDQSEYRTSFQYDGLNRMKRVLYPASVDGDRTELIPIYNRAGSLEGLRINGAPFIDRIAYNPKGQRTLVSYGNGLVTRYAYHTQTFRLARLRTERMIQPLELLYRSDGPPLQDMTYEYDLVGNVRHCQDRTPGSGVLNNPESAKSSDQHLAQLLVSGDALLRHFAYDPLYRLIAASGRECSDIPAPRPWLDDQRCGFNSDRHGTPNQDNAPNLSTVYSEEYVYDPVGNIVSLTHGSQKTVWTRQFGMGGLSPSHWGAEWPKHLNVVGVWSSPAGNRLTHAGDNDPNVGQTHFFDENGNLLQENTTRWFDWDTSNRMCAYRTQVLGSEPSIIAQYLYDSGGQRVKKLLRKQGGRIEVTVNIDGIFEHRLLIESSTVRSNSSIHVLDGVRRISVLRAGDVFPGDATPDIVYHMSDHLGSSCLVTDAAGGWVNREEYAPYGETTFGSFSRKRYRYVGKERDEESGLVYYGARYYAPWLMRWVSCDPAGTRDGPNLYRMVRDNPVSLIDPVGAQSSAPEHELSLGSTSSDSIQRYVESAISVRKIPRAAGSDVKALRILQGSLDLELDKWNIPHPRSVAIEPRDNSQSAGGFSRSEWSIRVTPKLFPKQGSAGHALTPEQFSELAGTVYHEYQHLVEAYLAVRYGLGSGASKRQVVRDLGDIHPQVLSRAASKAGASPLDSSGIGATVYKAYLTERADPRQRLHLILTVELHALQKIEAQKAFDETNTLDHTTLMRLYGRVAEAERERVRALDEYRNLPLERLHRGAEQEVERRIVQRLGQ